MAKFLKYAGLSVLVQLLACIVVWVLTVLTAPMFNPVFDMMFRFYQPPILLLSLLGGTGESAMIATGVFGILFGIISYGIIFGIIITILKNRR